MDQWADSVDGNFMPLGLSNEYPVHLSLDFCMLPRISGLFSGVCLTHKSLNMEPDRSAVIQSKNLKEKTVMAIE